MPKKKAADAVLTPAPDPADEVFDRALRRRVDEVRQGRKLGLAEAPAGEGMLPGGL